MASPRHADLLLVTGPVTLNMREALERTYAATPAPKWVVAVGDCGAGCGVFADSYACVGAVSKVIPVDLVIRGCPPTPTDLLQGLLVLLSDGAAAACERQALMSVCWRDAPVRLVEPRRASRPSAAPYPAPRRRLRRFVGGCPRLPGPLLDVAANQAPHDLGGRGVLLRTQALEQRLLARIDEDRQSCGAVFESHGHP